MVSCFPLASRGSIKTAHMHICVKIEGSEHGGIPVELPLNQAQQGGDENPVRPPLGL